MKPEKISKKESSHGIIFKKNCNSIKNERQAKRKTSKQFEQALHKKAIQMADIIKSNLTIG